MTSLQIKTDSASATEALGASLGAILKPGTFLALKGEMGGGKTCLTRGLVATLAPESAHLVASPTYAIMNSYSGNIPVHHFDFYRLTGDNDIAELGFEDYFYDDAICVAEWSERLDELLPSDVLTLLFEHLGGDRRLISITGSGQKSDEVISQLKEIIRMKKNFDQRADYLL